ncbi:MAG: GFA family protein, partial [Planctomycetes bacterium]|nr:GFA family protein [Planctomycetota bacterium]
MTGEPNVMGLCRCTDCAKWMGAPVSAFALWPRDSLRFLKGEENVGVFNKTENSTRNFGKTCGEPDARFHPRARLS